VVMGGQEDKNIDPVGSILMGAVQAQTIKKKKQKKKKKKKTSKEKVNTKQKRKEN
jgi:hypothetical protein